jgi:hypothetical protein
MNDIKRREGIKQILGTPDAVLAAGSQQQERQHAHPFLNRPAFRAIDDRFSSEGTCLLHFHHESLLFARQYGNFVQRLTAGDERVGGFNQRQVNHAFGLTS